MRRCVNCKGRVPDGDGIVTRCTGCQRMPVAREGESGVQLTIDGVTVVVEWAHVFELSEELRELALERIRRRSVLPPEVL